MSELFQIYRLTSNPCLTGEDQQRFWRRIHRRILKDKPWWRLTSGMIWVDLIYQGNDPYTVYLTLPQNVIEHLPHYIRGKEKRIKRRWPYNTVDREVLQVPSHLSVCELKLGFDNIFSLPSNEVWLPDRLPLEATEKARVSFGITPIHKMGINMRRNQAFRSKMEMGFREYRGAVDESSLFTWLIYHLNHWIQRLLMKKGRGEQGDPYLSKETIRKLNDSHFKVYIRIAAHQRHIPKLAIPMEKLKGENEFKLQFLPKKEQRACLNEINKQKTGLYSLSDLNPNILGGRELSYLFPFLSNDNRESGEISRLKFK